MYIFYVYVVINCFKQLQAAEARINEANAGLGSGVEDNDEPLQEVFSETQRYGRVSRYELRPGRYGQGARPATVFGEDRTNSPVRRSPEFSLVRKQFICVIFWVWLFCN